MIQELILVRGISGSGKSTFAELVHKLARNLNDHTDELEHIIVSADDYFTDTNGNYDFNPADLPKAHYYCQNIVYMAMKQAKIDEERGIGSIILVHNTFTQDWEMKPYFNLAKEHGFKVTTIIVENRHESNSIHNVPKDVINRQKIRFDIKL